MLRLNVNDNPWGWYQDFESIDENYFPLDYMTKGSTSTDDISSNTEDNCILKKTKTLPVPAKDPPLYILTASLEDQQLWYKTAGRRQPQPMEEREYYEALWSKNFEISEAEFNSLAKKNSRDDILLRSSGHFSNAVSKSFANSDFSSIRIQVPGFQIRRDNTFSSVVAEYLVVVSFDNHTFGVWKRHSDFKKLAKKIHNDPGNEYKNTSLSWRCLIYKQKWFRCIDKDYLALKCFLLERFMHDFLFESHSPNIISEFLELS